MPASRRQEDNAMNGVLRGIGIAASVVMLACGTVACKKADTGSADTGAAAGSGGAMGGPAAASGGAMGGPAAASGPLGASGAASTDAASGASQ
jgi:hypothetical protein